MKFDAYVALDWSGAAGRRYAGIAIAELGADAATPRLIRPRDRLWSRSEAVAWLEARLRGPDRVLAGIDCAFSLPGNAVPGPELWAAVDRASSEAADFYGAPYVAAESVAHRYWTRGTMPAGWVDHHRATEQACLAQGLGAPQSPYKLIGAKQVGKGALAGMRALMHLKAALGQRISVWPFEPLAGGSVLVEIYPRLFLRRVGHGSAKVRTRAELDRCLDALGCSPFATRSGFDDHEADALVSAAGLRLLAGAAQSWKPAADAAILAREGWIFGVP